MTPTTRTARPLPSRNMRAADRNHRTSPSGRTMRQESRRWVSPPARALEKAATARARSSGCRTACQSRWERTSVPGARPSNASNFSLHSTWEVSRSMSNTPILPASCASSSRSLACCMAISARRCSLTSSITQRDAFLNPSICTLRPAMRASKLWPSRRNSVDTCRTAPPAFSTGPTWP
ncbi:hypothetical protein D3C71_1410360 [compost metagenome]